MNIQKTEAIVINSFDYGEFDKIVKFFTKDFGLLSGFAKGAKKDWKRFSNALNLFSVITLQFKEGKGSLVKIIECDIKDYFLGIQEDIRKIALASFCFELVSKLSGEMEKNSNLYDLLKDILTSLDKNPFNRKYFSIFIIDIMELLGYKYEVKIGELEKTNKLIAEFAQLICGTNLKSYNFCLQIGAC